MQLYLLFLFLSLLIFLFSLYWVGKDDLILLRKNIALEQLFNITLVTLGIGLLFARIFYVLFNPSTQYLNPLVFLVFPYYPGLSLFGGIVGASAYLWYLHYRKKIPFGRLADFFSCSLLVSLPVGVVGSMFISPRQELVSLFVVSLVYIFMSVVFLMYLYPKLCQNQIKEGTIFLLFILIFVSVRMAESFYLQSKGFWLFFGLEQILVLILGVGACGLLMRNTLHSPKRR